MLPEKDKIRLIQLLGMIGSDHDGEVLNAARLARRVLRDYKLSWEEVVNGVNVNGSATPKMGAANRAAGEAERQQAYQEGFDKAAKLAADALRREYSRGFQDGVNNAKSIGVAANRTWKEWAQNRVDNDTSELSDWETNFFGDFSRGRYSVPTDKQRTIFERVGRRLGIALPGADDDFDDA